MSEGRIPSEEEIRRMLGEDPPADPIPQPTITPVDPPDRAAYIKNTHTGQLYELPPGDPDTVAKLAEINAGLDTSFRLAHPAEVNAARQEQWIQDHHALADAAAFVRGAAGGLGIVEGGMVAAEAAGLLELPGDPKELARKLRDAGPVGLEILGGIAPFLATGGASLAAARGLGAVAKTANAAARVSPTAQLANLATQAGGKVTQALGQRASARIAGLAAAGGVEGFGYAAGQMMTEAALNPELTAESALTHIGLGAVLGAGVGGALGAVGEVMSPLWNRVGGLTRNGTVPTEDALAGVRKLVGPGVSDDVVETLAQYSDRALQSQAVAGVRTLRRAGVGGDDMQQFLKALRDKDTARAMVLADDVADELVSKRWQPAMAHMEEAAERLEPAMRARVKAHGWRNSTTVPLSHQAMSDASQILSRMRQELTELTPGEVGGSMLNARRMLKVLDEYEPQVQEIIANYPGTTDGTWRLANAMDTINRRLGSMRRKERGSVVGGLLDAFYNGDEILGIRGIRQHLLDASHYGEAAAKHAKLQSALENHITSSRHIRAEFLADSGEKAIDPMTGMTTFRESKVLDSSKAGFKRFVRDSGTPQGQRMDDIMGRYLDSYDQLADAFEEFYALSAEGKAAVRELRKAAKRGRDAFQRTTDFATANNAFRSIEAKIALRARTYQGVGDVLGGGVGAIGGAMAGAALGNPAAGALAGGLIGHRMGQFVSHQVKLPLYMVAAQVQNTEALVRWATIAARGEVMIENAVQVALGKTGAGLGVTSQFIKSSPARITSLLGLQQVYEETRAQVERLDVEELADSVAGQLLPFAEAAPGGAHAGVQKVRGALAYLKGKTPPTGPANALGGGLEPPPTPQQMIRYLNTVDATLAPAGILARLAQNKLTGEDAEVLENVYPALRNGVIQALTRSDAPKMKKRAVANRLGIVTDVVKMQTQTTQDGAQQRQQRVVQSNTGLTNKELQEDASVSLSTEISAGL